MPRARPRVTLSASISARTELIGPRALPAAKRRDGAEPAPAIAPLGDLDVGPRRARLRPRELQQIEAVCRAVDGARLVDRHAPRAGRIFISTGTPNPATRSISAERGRELLARALCKAAGHDEPGPLFAQPVELENGLDRLLACSLDERAGVDDDKVGPSRIRRRLEPARCQAADQLLRVDVILRAAERRDPKALAHLRSLPMQIQHSRSAPSSQRAATLASSNPHDPSESTPCCPGHKGGLGKPRGRSLETRGRARLDDTPHFDESAASLVVRIVGDLAHREHRRHARVGTLRCFAPTRRGSSS